MVENERTLVGKIDVIQERLRQAYERLRSVASEEVREEIPSGEETPPVLETPVEQTLPPLNEDLFDEIGLEHMIGSAELVTHVENDEPGIEEAGGRGGGGTGGNGE